MLQLGVPDKHLIIFAGAEGRHEILSECRVEAALFSFFPLHRPGLWSRVREALDAWTWPHYRYLDSGAYTFITRSQNNDHQTATGGKSLNNGPAVTREELRPFFKDYCEFLRENIDQFSWVLDLDVDSIPVDGVPGSGVELTLKHREELLEIPGVREKLLPVWHRAAGRDAWYKLISQYEYVAIGFDCKPKDRARIAAQPKFGIAVDQAHRRKVKGRTVKVHALGVASSNTLEKVRYDTADATSWDKPVRHGGFIGSKHTLEQRVEDLGGDVALIHEGKDKDREKLKMNIRLLQQQQEEWNGNGNER